MSEQRTSGVLSRIPAWMRPIPEWFCRYPFLLLMTGLVLAIVWGLAGVDYGVPFLFWADRPLEQYVAALGVTCLLGKFCFNGYLLACDACWMRKPNGELRPLRWYLAVTWLPLLVFGLLLRVLIPAMGDDSFTKSFNDANYAASLVKHIPFVMGVLAGVLLSIAFVLFAKSLQIQLMPVRWLNTNRLKDKLPSDLRDHVEQEGKGIVPEELQDQVPVDVTLHALSITFFLLFGVLFLALVFYRPAYNYLPPALVICVMLGLIADLYGAICFHSPRAVHLVTTLLVLITILCSAAPDKHRFVGLEAYYAHPESLDNEHYDQRRQEDCGLIKDGALPNWLAYYYAHRAVTNAPANNPAVNPSPVEHPAVEYRAAAFRGADRKTVNTTADDKNARSATREKRIAAETGPALPKLVVIATSGGGLRSAYWTATVLQELEAAEPGFFYNVRLITGASGGMLGAAHFVSKLDALQKFDVANDLYHAGRLNPTVMTQRRHLLTSLKIAANLEQSNLPGVAQYWALQDMPRSFCPLPYYKDRGWALEEAWRVNLAGALDQPVRALREGEDAGWRPSLVFAPMLVEDGRRLLVSNLDLDAMTQTSGALQSRRGLYSLSAIEFYRLFPQADQFKLSTAVRMNASFPYASPASALPTVPSRRVVDAGYYDNFGITVAAAWIYSNLPWIQANTSGVVLIQIRDAVSQTNRQNIGLEEEQDPPSWVERGLKEWTTPIAASLAAREASMSFRNDEQLRDLDHILNRGRSKLDRFTTMVIECPVRAELNWSLTKIEIDAIKSGIAASLSEEMKVVMKSRPRYARLNASNRSRASEVKSLLETPAK